MPQTIQCPKCQSQLQIDDGAWSEWFQCPACRGTFKARPATPAPAAAPAARSSAPAGPERAPWEEEPAWKKLPPPKPFVVHQEFQAKREDLAVVPHRGPLILALGFTGMCLFIVMPAGWILGGMAIAMGGDDLQRMHRDTMEKSGHVLTLAGRICGIVAVVLSTVVLLLVILRMLY